MTHPILTATTLIDEALKAVADTHPTFMPTADKAEALKELVRIESRVSELRMRILADSADLAADTGARDATGWFADATHTRFEDARADLRLACGLERRWHALGAAVREGRVNTAQARVIVRALDDLPDAVPQEVLDAAEAALIHHADRFTPQQLARTGATSSPSSHRTSSTRPRAGGWPSSSPRRGVAPGSPSAASATGRHGSRADCPTPSRPGSRSTSRPTPTRGVTTTSQPSSTTTRLPGVTRRHASPVRGGSARRSAS